MTGPTNAPVGHAKNQQYKTGAKMHAVIHDGDAAILLCTGGPATYEYDGTIAAIDCDRCRSARVRQAALARRS